VRIEVLMQRIYDLLGRWLFPRRQVWDQRKSAKILVLTVTFSLAMGLALAFMVRMMYYHTK
jgi:hypothetical protein